MPTGEKRRRTAGFRFSYVDGIAIVLCTIVTWLALPAFGIIAWLPAIVLGHFFLFCNVFRIHRTKELIWAGFFIINFSIWLLLAPLQTPLEWILLTQIPITVFLIGMETRGANYHGVFAKQLNPQLDAYLNADY